MESNRVFEIAHSDCSLVTRTRQERVSVPKRWIHTPGATPLIMLIHTTKDVCCTE
jgi:hypothetical protein